jgi:hypothetical protein
MGWPDAFDAIPDGDTMMADGASKPRAETPFEQATEEENG